MPRPRKHNPSIPAHIDQARLPVGIYWDNTGKGRWLVRENGKAKMVAGARARLSDLHAIMEQRSGSSQRGTVSFYIERFHASTKFRQLAPRTQKDYERQAEIIRKHMLPMGIALGDVLVARLSTVHVQKVVDRLDKDGTPTKANHLLRYLRRVLSHAVRHEGLESNPAKGVEQAKERGRKGMPTLSAFGRVLAFARTGAARQAHTEGSMAAYLPHLMVISTAVCLRGIEAVTLTEAPGMPEGILADRRKGSRDNVARWSPELREAWDALLAIRSAAWERNRCAVPLRAEDRPMIVTESGRPLSKAGLDAAWQRLTGRQSRLA